MRRGHLMLVPLLIAAALIAYQFLGAETFTNAETGERHRVALSIEQESALGLEAYEDVLAHEHVVGSGPQVEMVRRIAARLAQATGDPGAQFDWRVSLVDSDQQNAFCLPGGKIVVYTGILGLARTEAGLATVMGHEMAHATSRHGAQRLFQERIAQTAMLGARGALGDMDPSARERVMAVLGAGASLGVLLPFSREHEAEADAIGLHYMARAGFDPRESIAFWQRMSTLSSAGQPSEFVSTHPSHASRIQGLEAEMPAALAEYAATRR